MPDLEPGIIEKLVAAGITTVEAVADMTPEQLEEVPGIGPKTVEKISIAVNNYFSSLDAAELRPPKSRRCRRRGCAGEEAALADEAADAGDEAGGLQREEAAAAEDAELSRRRSCAGGG